jgi:hypothetical protein
MELGNNNEKLATGGNVKSIEKKVAEVNELIKYANDNKIEVVDESGTWQAPMKYKPIKYSNGVLYIEYDELDLYKHNKGQGTFRKTVKDKVLKRDMQFDNPLNDIAKMYRKAVKHHKEYGYYATGGGVGDEYGVGDIGVYDFVYVKPLGGKSGIVMEINGSNYRIKTDEGRLSEKEKYYKKSDLKIAKGNKERLFAQGGSTSGFKYSIGGL